MNSLFRNINRFTAKRENATKEALINTLNENARDIQFEAQQNGQVLELCEQTSALCTTLEAIFLHGLKDSFLSETINVIAGDVERRPEPSFWSPLMVFMHKQVIEQIQTLSQITSEIGQCRAWVRISLNESVFTAYLNNMRKNPSALSPYYKKFALLKDADGMKIAAKIMEKLEAFTQFCLPVNSSLLNQWPDYSLQLSGLWTPALKSCPISNGVDVAGSINDDTVAIPTPQPLRTNELFSESISNSPFSRTANFGSVDLNQRENLDLFLQKVDELDKIDEEDNAEAKEVKTTAEKQEQSGTCKRKRKRSTETTPPKIEEEFLLDEASNALHGGNSLTNLMQNSWSSGSTEDDISHSNTICQPSVSMVSSTNSLRFDRCSYNALLRKHERNRESDWLTVWQKFLSHSHHSVALNNSNSSHRSGASGEDQEDLDSSNYSRTHSEFEVLTGNFFDNFDMCDLQKMVQHLCHLPHEPGLNSQGFLCKSCQHPLGIGYTNFRVCAFNGHYYCDGCMDLEPIVIPSRIIYNWDFRKFPVSKSAAAFLAEFRNQPFIDLKILNPAIYHASDAMAELQSLRIRLNFIRAYLHTCGPSSIEELQHQFFGKEYLYEHIHQYSIADLSLIQRGTLYQQLQKAYKLGEAHILKCHLCSVKGFICEICNSARVLYPFHIDTTFRCETCGAVFHAHCLNDQQPCPKCERKRKREDLPLLEAVQNLKLKNDIL